MRLNRNLFLSACLITAAVFFGGCASQAIRNGDVIQFGGDIQQLQQIYETPIPAQIRRAFDRTAGHICSRDPEECSGCAFTVQEGGKRVDIFTKKFIIVSLEPAHFGGVEATIVFQGAPNAFWLWLYDVDPNEYQLRSIEQLPEPLDKGLVRQLQAPAYQQYWL